MTDDSAMEEGRLEEIAARCKGSTPGPWEWIDPEDDSPWNPRSYRASLRTVNHSDRVEIGSGRYRDLPVFILEAEDLDASDPQALINAEFLRHARTDVPDLLTEVRRLRAENDALKQQLQALREQDHMCLELVQEIADSKICWSDWAGDYIQWTEDITRKARKALGLKDE